MKELKEAWKAYWKFIVLMAVVGAFLGAGFCALILYASNDRPTPVKQTICVAGTYLQADNTCLPPNSTSMKGK